jgi:hypothetical protein
MSSSVGFFPLGNSRIISRNMTVPDEFLFRIHQGFSLEDDFQSGVIHLPKNKITGGFLYKVLPRRFLLSLIVGLCQV